ncbi:hypothetical protein CLHOM_10240 [Clostridium homopropionicum DSM 5847]|uniref:DUF3307 domain-containing protein n=1 Tax=Clostridium homopropionicum DSM 5847 TaxID=1121318 RepID=A0A0L6ZBU0_9CLOT|nr:DUF3307 domain-containing protein [Clostridium homopropionicum]KOA20436.1 hypothetical protein CLHOM_10240 [Clostridium homopropionicum DSM 5847]SFG34849.1 Protein of unknown function [Clostridium homopropionicum]
MMNNSFFVIFILAHLIGDFVLQTDKIAKEKASSIKGVFVHSLIVILVQMLFLSVFGIKGIISGLISGSIHFFIDSIKLYISKNIFLKNKQTLYFLFDQAIHIAIILFLTLTFGKELGENYKEHIGYLKYAVSIITLTYASTVASKILIFDLDLVPKDKGFFMKDERILDAIVAILIWIIIGFIKWKLLIIALILVLFSLYLALGKKLYKYYNKVYFIKYIVYLIVSLILKF